MKKRALHCVYCLLDSLSRMKRVGVFKKKISRGVCNNTIWAAWLSDICMMAQAVSIVCLITIKTHIQQTNVGVGSRAVGALQASQDIYASRMLNRRAQRNPTLAGR